MSFAGRAAQSVLVAAWSTAVLFSAPGCAPLRSATKQATLGVKDAIEAPTRAENEKLVADLTEAVTRGLLRGLTRGAADPREREELAQLVRGGVAVLVAALAPELGKLPAAIRSTSAEATRGLIDGLASRREVVGALVEELSGRAGKAFAAQATEQLTLALGSNGDGTLARAAGGATQRVTYSAMHGLGEGTNLPCRTGDQDCLHALVRGLARAVSQGMTDGVGSRMSWWQMGLTFTLGVIAMLAAALVYSYLRRRTEMKAVKDEKADEASSQGRTLRPSDAPAS